MRTSVLLLFFFFSFSSRSFSAHAFAHLSSDLVCNATHSCPSPLRCYSSLCRLPPEFPCFRTPHHGPLCAPGTHCVGPPSAPRCMKPMQLGDFCGTEPYWVCTNGLVCDMKDQTCKRVLPLGADCSGGHVTCAEETACLKVIATSDFETDFDAEQYVDVDDVDDVDDDKTKLTMTCIRLQSKPGLLCNGHTVICNPDYHIMCATVEEQGSGEENSRQQMDTNDSNFIDVSNVINNNDDYGETQQHANTATRINGRCVLVENAPCSKATAHHCKVGTHCVGPARRRSCRTVVNVGGVCHRGPSSRKVCADGKTGRGSLTCQSGKCRIAKDGDCNGAETLCAWRLICVSSSSKGNGRDEKRCVRPLSVGKSCSAPFSRCRPGLLCDSHAGGFCRRPRDAHCSRLRTSDEKEEDCETGTKCVEVIHEEQTGLKAKVKVKVKVKRCVATATLGDLCNLSEDMKHVVCADDDATCDIDGTCRIGAGGMCGRARRRWMDGEWAQGVSSKRGTRKAKCIHGTKCVRGVCREILRLGMACGGDEHDNLEDSHQKNKANSKICERWLTCDDGHCRIQPGRPCDVVESHKRLPHPCTRGLTCVQGRCKRPAKFLEECRSPHLHGCEEGLSCDARNDVCKKGLMSNCNSDLECVNGTRCAGTKTPLGAKKCLKLLREKMVCGTAERGACALGLTCVRHRCERTDQLPNWSVCSIPGAKCAEGLRCVGRRHGMYCVRPGKKGEACDKISELAVCEDGLFCGASKRCVKMKGAYHSR